MNATTPSDNSNLGPFALSGPVAKPDPRKVPLRGDIAHIALAGRHFVPHYVVPMPLMVCDMGANMRAEASDASEIVYDLFPGQRFDVLDSNASWAWGCLGPDGPVGYVKTSELLDPFA